MKVLVTGGAGFIGSNVVKLLEEKGACVYILDDFSQASYRNIADVKADVICGSVTDEDLIRKLPKLDAVIHEGAITDTTLPDDTRMIDVNFNGFKYLFSFCMKNKVRLVYASSAGVYGDGQFPMKESQKARPLNTYAYSKYLCDKYTTSRKKTPALVVGLRYFNVYGPNEYHKGLSASMIYQLYLQMKQGKRPRVFKHGEQKRDFIYVKDIAALTVAALELKKNNILNVGTGIPRSFNDIIAALNTTLKTDLAPDYFDNPYCGVYQDFTQADTTRLNACGLSAGYSLEDGIKDYLANYLQKSL